MNDVSGRGERLEALAARCEAATGPDRELDAEIGALFGLCPHKKTTYERCQGDSGYTCDACGADSWGNRSKTGQGLRDPMPAYTASLDAAMTLVPEGWGVTIDIRAADRTRCEAHFWFDGDGVKPIRAVAAMPALALTAAALLAQSPNIAGGGE